MEVDYVIFGMKHKKYARDNSLQGWNDVAVWRDFKSPYIPGDIWPQYIEHVRSERFTRRSESSANNQNWQILFRWPRTRAAPFRLVHIRSRW
jgi:hypothetical protein